MANDNRANYGRIGFTVFLGALALAIALIYIAGIGDQRNEIMVETYYDYPVSGLSVGSAVNFRGVKIGEVRDINFVGAIYDNDEVSLEDYQRVIIVMALDTRKFHLVEGETPEDVLNDFAGAGIRATIASNAVTGMSRVEFNIPDNPAPPAKLTWKPKHYQIPPQPSLMENMSVSLAKALHQFNQTDFQSVWSNVAAVAENSAKVTGDISTMLEQERSAIYAILENFKGASESVDELVEKVKLNPSLLIRESDPDPLAETK